MGGVSCVLLSIMYVCTVCFFYKSHPRKRFNDDYNYRLPHGTNPGYIICLFAISSSFFGAISVVFINDVVIFSSAPYPCFIPIAGYIISVTSVMGVITFVFLCFNCFCYFFCVKSIAGSIC